MTMHESRHMDNRTWRMIRLRPYFNEELDREGYLSIEHFVSEAEVEPVRTILQRLWQERVGFERGAFFDFAAEGTGKSESFPQIFRPSELAPKLRKTEVYTRAAALARQVLGPGARFATDHALIKPALTGPVTPWHQDASFQDPGMDTHEVSIWVALQPVNTENGCLQFIPGSHKGPILPHQSPGGNKRIHALECYEGFDPSDAVACVLPTGGCTVHTGRTLHFAGPNRSDQHRLVYVLIFDLPATPAAVPREAPWLIDRKTARDEREQTWLRQGGIVTKQWIRLRRIDFRRPGELRYLLRRMVSGVGKLLRPGKVSS
jgi:ectoine hydroxylase-related dioxygenase (phytanoyl-CoA dioxygenase family)